ncbi:hypothetical protein PIB30_039028 [Stylosanthes scabra]|uniref:Uncharacterized protein n=1 Tax=Stylosanthes scabra TaxID=79078 RepID=A0ABU6REQ4_9FABA|nr:hypothetical protein [Stylosanthes scabra]
MGSGVISYEYEKCEKFEDYDPKADAELGTFKIRRYHFDYESFVHPLHSVRFDPDRPYEIPIEALMADQPLSSSRSGKSSARGSHPSRRSSPTPCYSPGEISSTQRVMHMMHAYPMARMSSFESKSVPGRQFNDHTRFLHVIEYPNTSIPSTKTLDSHSNPHIHRQFNSYNTYTYNKQQKTPTLSILWLKKRATTWVGTSYRDSKLMDFEYHAQKHARSPPKTWN